MLNCHTAFIIFILSISGSELALKFPYIWVLEARTTLIIHPIYQEFDQFVAVINIYMIWHAISMFSIHKMYLTAYEQYMKQNGGAIVNIIADMWRGFPGMA